MKNLLYRIVSCIFLPFIKLSKQDRARVMVRSLDGQVLLVKNKIGNQRWTFPGGGIKNGESGGTAASRELREELGVKSKSNKFISLGRTYFFESKTPFSAELYIYDLNKKAAEVEIVKNFEILDWGWFKTDNIPDELAVGEGVVRDLIRKRSKG